MSSSLAIAAVTRMLVQITKDALNGFTSTGDLVTVGTPQFLRGDRKDPQVNLFLYQVAPDAAWRNQDIPATTKPGERAYPLLPLKLQYLITAFGNQDDDTLAHEMLGSVMLKLHNDPILPRKNAVEGLAEQHEPVRLTLQPMTLDEATKLWSGIQSHYRLSVAYEASVVLIDSGKATQSAPPVLSRGGMDDPGFGAQPLEGEPAFQSTKPPYGMHGPRLAPLSPATKWIPDELILVGRNLDHSDLRLIFSHPRLQQGYIAKVVDPLEQSADRLRIRFPHGLRVIGEDPTKPLHEMEADSAAVINPSTDNWPAGVYTVAAARAVRTPPSNQPDRLYSTPQITFGLVPEIKVPADGAPSYRIQFSKNANGKIEKAELLIELVSKLILSGGQIRQSVKLFVGATELIGTVTTSDGLDIVWTASDPERTASSVKDLPDDARLLRVQVDGVDSSLLAPPIDSDSLPPKKFDSRLVVDLIGL